MRRAVGGSVVGVGTALGSLLYRVCLCVWSCVWTARSECYEVLQQLGWELLRGDVWFTLASGEPSSELDESRDRAARRSKSLRE